MQRTIRRHQVISLVVVLILPLFLIATSTGKNPDSTVDKAATTSSYIVQASSAAIAKTFVTRAGGKITAILNIIDAVGAELSEEQVEWLRSQPEGIRVFKDATLNVSGSVIETHGRQQSLVDTDVNKRLKPEPGTQAQRAISKSEPKRPNSSANTANTNYPTLIGAANLHEQGITGRGVTVAVLDTGLWKTTATEFSADGNRRILAQYDATVPRWYDIADCDDDDDCGDYDDDDDCGDDDDDDGGCWYGQDHDIDDWNGHGTHITSIMMSSGRTQAGRYQGVAPNANVVAVRAFEPDGSGTYLNVIKALDWIVSHRNQYDIRILNLSFGAAVASHYWDDPVNQAVMAAWNSGIIVVVAAGNGGPGPMTVGVPGNVPYVITVGAMTDNFTPQDTSDDKLTTFSAAGPTYEGFVKPELVAPGGHMLGQMPPYAWLPQEHPEVFQPVNNNYFTMSGTSQATAVVSGVLALMLHVDPTLSPDQAKCRVLASARIALRDDGTHAYSIFQQGAGLVDAKAAIDESAVDCANQGLDIGKDLAGTEHYAGPSGVDENGTYYLLDDNGTRQPGTGLEWSQGSLWPGGALWQSGSMWGQGSLWGQGGLWGQGVSWQEASSLNPDSLLNQGSIWPEGWSEGLTQSVSTNVWVDAE